MVKVRDVIPAEKPAPKKKAASVKTKAEHDKEVDQFGNEALAKVPRKKPANQHKAISIPFTEDGYKNLVAAAAKAERKPTEFIKLAIQKAVQAELKRIR